jgi:hypothetical protein
MHHQKLKLNTRVFLGERRKTMEVNKVIKEIGFCSRLILKGDGKYGK